MTRLLINLTERWARGWCIDAAAREGGLRRRAAMAVYSLPWI